MPVLQWVRRVNPTTGQILDADIIFDSDFLQAWRNEYETFTPKSIADLTGGPLDLKSYEAWARLQARTTPRRPTASYANWAPVVPATSHLARWRWQPRRE